MVIRSDTFEIYRWKQTVWLGVRIKRATRTEKPERWREAESDIVREPEPLLGGQQMVFPCWRFLQATQLLALPGPAQPPRHWSWQHWPCRLHALCLQLSRHTEEKQKRSNKKGRRHPVVKMVTEWWFALICEQRRNHMHVCCGRYRQDPPAPAQEGCPLCCLSKSREDRRGRGRESRGVGH
ncbi:hypothetical protein EYF80_000610 [Liparis tanakae]|uniref:Uncharacterized protein n=1 Tax=Liparis tanakae TaxID=230148 RepID=A0A4Z2JJC0_9TELE|nr:hypothetical protein EYF80_000610 [Liparis tanakae]